MSNTIHGLHYVDIRETAIYLYSQSSATNLQRQAGINYPTEQDLGGYEGENNGLGYSYELKKVSTGVVYNSTIVTNWNTLGNTTTGTTSPNQLGPNVDMISRAFTGLTPGETYQLKSTNFQGDVKTYNFHTPLPTDWGNYGNTSNRILYTYIPSTDTLEVELRFDKSYSNVASVSEALRTDLTFTDANGVETDRTILNPATDGNVTQNYDVFLLLYDPNKFSGAGSSVNNASAYAELQNGCGNYNGDCFSNSAAILGSAYTNLDIKNEYQTHVVNLSNTPQTGDWGYNIPDGSGGSTRVKILWNDFSTFTDTSTPGCTDSSAFNYNPNATIDDGSCCYVGGCTDSTASNYNAAACHDDGSCVYPSTGSVECDSIMGHMGLIPITTGASTPSAADGAVKVFVNYDINQWNASSGNCSPSCDEEDFALDFRFDINLTEWDVTTNSAVTGGYTASMSDVAIPDNVNQTLSTNSTILNDASNFWLTNVPAGIYKVTTEVVNTNGTGSQNCACIDTLPNGTAAPWSADWMGCTMGMIFQVNSGTAPISGCTDSTAINYNPNATIDDGSCTYPSNPVLGCTNPIATNYNASATVNDGSCIYPSSYYGCTNPAATNYDPSAIFDDGSCNIPIYGCTNPSSVNYNPLATVDNGSCVPCVYGCTNHASSNYNPLATCDDGSCAGCVYGCTDSSSSNYDSNATCDDGSCCVDGCIDPNALNYNVLATCDDQSCEYCVYGCTDPNASNYDSSATCDDGSCLETECSDCFKLLNVLYKEANCDGCTEDDYITEKQNLQRFTNLRIMRDMAYACGDTAYVKEMQFEEYQLCSTLLDEHTNEGPDVDFKIYGCTNPNSKNYDPKATHPCEKNGILNYCCGDTDPFKVSGCTDPLASNYNPNANIDDGSCMYASPNVSVNNMTSNMSQMEEIMEEQEEVNELTMDEKSRMQQGQTQGTADNITGNTSSTGSSSSSSGSGGGMGGGGGY